MILRLTDTCTEQSSAGDTRDHSENCSRQHSPKVPTTKPSLQSSHRPSMSVLHLMQLGMPQVVWQEHGHIMAKIMTAANTGEGNTVRSWTFIGNSLEARTNYRSHMEKKSDMVCHERPSSHLHGEASTTQTCVSSKLASHLIIIKIRTEKGGIKWQIIRKP